MLDDQAIQIDYGKLDSRNRKAFDTRLAKKIITLNKHLKYSKMPDRLKVRIQSPKNSQYIIDLTLLNDLIIRGRGEGNTVVKALEIAFDPLRENLLKIMERNKKQHFHSSRQKRSQILNSAYDSLNLTIKRQSKKDFSLLLTPLLHDLRVYIKRRLNYARQLKIEGALEITINEILNQVVEKAFTQFEQKKSDFSLEHWLFYLSDSVLDENLKESAFEAKHLEDWDKYLQQAIDDQDETMTMSAEGVPELVENLDEADENLLNPSQLGYEIDYHKNLSDKDKIKSIKRILAKLPVLKRSIFELSVIDGFANEEIAKIKNLKPTEVSMIIDETRDFIIKNTDNI